MPIISSVIDPRTSACRPRSSETSLWKRLARSSPCDRVLSSCMVAMTASLVCMGHFSSAAAMGKNLRCCFDSYHAGDEGQGTGVLPVGNKPVTRGKIPGDSHVSGDVLSGVDSEDVDRLVILREEFNTSLSFNRDLQRCTPPSLIFWYFCFFCGAYLLLLLLLWNRLPLRHNVVRILAAVLKGSTLGQNLVGQSRGHSNSLRNGRTQGLSLHSTDHGDELVEEVSPPLSLSFGKIGQFSQEVQSCIFILDNTFVLNSLHVKILNNVTYDTQEKDDLRESGHLIRHWQLELGLSQDLDDYIQDGLDSLLSSLVTSLILKKLHGGVTVYSQTIGIKRGNQQRGEIPTLSVMKVLSLSPEQSPNLAAMNSATEGSTLGQNLVGQSRGHSNSLRNGRTQGLSLHSTDHGDELVEEVSPPLSLSFGKIGQFSQEVQSCIFILDNTFVLNSLHYTMIWFHALSFPSSRGTARAEMIPLLKFKMVVVSPSSGSRGSRAAVDVESENTERVEK
ncbi:hypothetical protein INR49_028629 [Caranx melampygus]|nr:hypothetical protein INR49_028629 [Caranx melampygus]